METPAALCVCVLVCVCVRVRVCGCVCACVLPSSEFQESLSGHLLVAMTAVTGNKSITQQQQHQIWTALTGSNWFQMDDRLALTGFGWIVDWP